MSCAQSAAFRVAEEEGQGKDHGTHVDVTGWVHRWTARWPRESAGRRGERLHYWAYDLASWRERQGLAFGQINRDAEVIEESLATVGGTVMGRRMFDEGEVPWADNPPFRAPVFVLTHDPRETLVKQGGTTFTFVTDGVHSALEQARAAAGDRDVAVAGGAHDIREFIQAGLLDELEIHLAPVLLAADADSSRTWARSASNSRTQGLSTRGESRISSFAS